MTKNKKMTIGVDIGGTNIGGGIVDEKGNVLYKMSELTNPLRQIDAIIQDIANIIKTLHNKAEEENITIEAVGIGVPGPVNKEKGIVIKAINLGWCNLPLKDIIEKNVGLKVYLENDATAAGLAEFKYGAMTGAKSGALLTLGTGVGGGLIINGKPLVSESGISPELGHIIVGNNFYNCNCGNNGCLETFASATALIKYVKKEINQEGKISSITQKSNNLRQDIDGKIIFDSAKEGDTLAVEAVDRLANYLAIGIINIIAVVDPEYIVIGGGLAKAGDFLLDKIKAAVKKRKYYPELPIGNIKLTTLNNNAGIIGAATLTLF